MALEYSGQIFEKYSNIKFHEKPPSGSLGIWGRADEETDPDETNSSCIAIWRTRLTTVVFPHKLRWGRRNFPCAFVHTHCSKRGIWRCCSNSVNPAVRGVWLRRCETSLQTPQGFVGVMTQLPLQLARLCVISLCLSGYNEIDLREVTT